MSKKPETIFGEKVDADLRENFGDKVEIFNIQQVAKVGDPDRLICLNGNFIALELKCTLGRIAKAQTTKLKRVLKAGGFALVVYPHTWHIILRYLKATYGKR
jgi:hypothetical protein